MLDINNLEEFPNLSIDSSLKQVWAELQYINLSYDTKFSYNLNNWFAMKNSKNEDLIGEGGGVIENLTSSQNMNSQISW